VTLNDLKRRNDCRHASRAISAVADLVDTTTVHQVFGHHLSVV